MANGFGGDFLLLDHCNHRGLWLVKESMGGNEIVDPNKEFLTDGSLNNGRGIGIKRICSRREGEKIRIIVPQMFHIS
jgi:hypothetical protein